MLVFSQRAEKQKSIYHFPHCNNINHKTSAPFISVSLEQAEVALKVIDELPG